MSEAPRAGRYPEEARTARVLDSLRRIRQVEGDSERMRHLEETTEAVRRGDSWMAAQSLGRAIASVRSDEDDTDDSLLVPVAASASGPSGPLDALIDSMENVERVVRALAAMLGVQLGSFPCRVCGALSEIDIGGRLWCLHLDHPVEDYVGRTVEEIAAILRGEASILRPYALSQLLHDVERLAEGEARDYKPAAEQMDAMIRDQVDP